MQDFFQIYFSLGIMYALYRVLTGFTPQLAFDGMSLAAKHRYYKHALYTKIMVWVIITFLWCIALVLFIPTWLFHLLSKR